MRDLTKLSQAERLQEILRCKSGFPGSLNGFRYWLATYVRISDDTLGSIPFEVWPCHLDAIDALEADKYLIILKARQIGMSWLYGAAYPLYLATFFHNKLALLFSQTDDDAAELIVKARFLWSQLPAWCNTSTGTVYRILSAPSTSAAGSIV